MDLTRWPHLLTLIDAASATQLLQVWLFGSALTEGDPTDLDVLLIYQDREPVVGIRRMAPWSDLHPPVDLIAMTAREEEEYDFIASTGAVRLL